VNNWDIANNNGQQYKTSKTRCSIVKCPVIVTLQLFDSISINEIKLFLYLIFFFLNYWVHGEVLKSTEFVTKLGCSNL